MVLLESQAKKKCLKGLQNYKESNSSLPIFFSQILINDLLSYPEKDQQFKYLKKIILFREFHLEHLRNKQREFIKWQGQCFKKLRAGKEGNIACNLKEQVSFKEVREREEEHFLKKLNFGAGGVGIRSQFQQTGRIKKIFWRLICLKQAIKFNWCRFNDHFVEQVYNALPKLNNKLCLTKITRIFQWFTNTIVFGSIFEQGQVSSEKILAHKIYRQDIKFNNNFAEIPKIVLGVIGYHSDFNALDFFSKVTDVTSEGFQLQVISDCEINQIRFNYLATEHKDVQTICNNIEVQKDQIDIKFNTVFEEQPQVAAFLTGIHRKNQDDIILAIKSIDKNQVQLTTKSNAESSLGLCLLIGPQDLFQKKDLSILQISQGIPNTQFYGISSLIGVYDNGVQLSSNQESFENSFEIGFTMVEINPEHIKQQEEDNNTVTFFDSLDKSSPQEQQGSQINSISYIYPEQGDQLQVEDQKENSQQAQENMQEVMTISESWLQHDLSVLDQSEESLNKNQAQVNEGLQFLTNLIKPQDYNTNSIEQSFNQQPLNIAIVDSTQTIVDENQKKVINNQEFMYENSIVMDSTLDYDIETKIENQIEEQIDTSQEQNVVEDLQDQIMEMQQEMQNLQQNSESNESSELDPFKIIQSQQFIVEQQKQLVEQQQQTIYQFQKLFEDQVKLQSEIKPNNELDEQVDSNLNQIEDPKQNQVQNYPSINQNIEQNLQPDKMDQNKEEPQIQDQLEQNDKDKKDMLKENQSVLEKDLESFSRVKKRKDEIDEQQAIKIVQEFTKDLYNDKTLDVGLNDGLQINQSDKVESKLNNEMKNIMTNKREEFSNIQKNMRKTQNFEDINKQFENISLEDERETIQSQEYEMEQDQDQELVQQRVSSNLQFQEEIQKQIEEFLELENKDSHSRDPIFSDFHSFFSVNQQIKNNLRKRKVLNV